MEVGKALYIDKRKDWRLWLEKNYEKEKEVWLIFPNKSTGKKRLDYNDAVEEALCFGWIDSIVKKYDKDSSAQRFTPRNPGSKYSIPNKMRLIKLVKEGRIIPSLLSNITDVIKDKYVFPGDIINEIKSNKEAWKNFKKFSRAYREIRIAFIDGARMRPDEYRKRLNYFIRMTKKNKQFGFGGIEKYF